MGMNNNRRLNVMRNKEKVLWEMGSSERAGNEGIRAEFNWKESFHAGLEGEIGFRPRIKNTPGKDTYAGMEEDKQKTGMRNDA